MNWWHLQNNWIKVSHIWLKLTSLICGFFFLESLLKFLKSFWSDSRNLWAASLPVVPLPTNDIVKIVYSSIYSRLFSPIFSLFSCDKSSKFFFHNIFNNSRLLLLNFHYSQSLLWLTRAFTLFSTRLHTDWRLNLIKFTDTNFFVFILLQSLAFPWFSDCDLNVKM